MDNNSNKHQRSLVTVSISEELDKEKCSMCNMILDEHMNGCVPVSLEEMMRCLGIQTRSSPFGESSQKLN